MLLFQKMAWAISGSLPRTRSALAAAMMLGRGILRAGGGLSEL
jgi:hypothetical protein